MKIAWCFYGQPRNLQEGYNNIKNYISNEKINVDFFCHAWYNNNKDISQSPWAKKRNNNIYIHETHMKNIIELYSPKKFLFEHEQEFNIECLKNTLLLNNTTNNNGNNVLSACYSTQIVIKLLLDYCKEIKQEYDIVYISRYDFLKPITLKPVNINTNYIYSTNIHKIYERELISPALLCGGMDIMLSLLLDIYDIIFEIKNDYNLDKILKQDKYKCKLYLNHEEIFLSNIIQKNIVNIIYTKDIPNFM
jgi:hypothetical protein